jgi:uncharacterized protein YcfJ
MTSWNRKLQALMLTSALLVPVAASAQVSWSKPDSRTKGTVIGAVAGGLIGGTKGAVIGGAVGNGVQAYRHDQHRKSVRHVAHRRHKRHHHHA